LSNPDQRRRRQFIEGLRAVAQFYEENPGAWYDGIHLTLNMYIWGRKTREILARTVRSFGQCTKLYDDAYITVSRKFGDQVTLSVLLHALKYAGVSFWDPASYPPEPCPRAGRYIYRLRPKRSSHGDATRCYKMSHPPKRFLPPENKCVDPTPFSA
jgi:hypothetical protein